MKEYLELRAAADEMVRVVDSRECKSAEPFIKKYSILWPRFVEDTNNASYSTIDENFIKTVKHFIDVIQFNKESSKTVSEFVRMYNISFPKLVLAYDNYCASQNKVPSNYKDLIIELIRCANLIDCWASLHHGKDCYITYIPGTIWLSQKAVLDKLANFKI